MRRLGGGDEAYHAYVEVPDNDTDKNSALIWDWYTLLQNPIYILANLFHINLVFADDIERF